jgi:hypothetical protein
MTVAYTMRVHPRMWAMDTSALDLLKSSFTLPENLFAQLPCALACDVMVAVF